MKYVPINEMIDRAENVLLKDDILPEYVDQVSNLPVIAITITGDWKHSHLRAR